MRSTTPVRAVIGVVALLSITIFINPVAADGVIYLTDSCHGEPRNWLSTQVERTINIAGHILDDLGSNRYSEFRKGVTWFLQDDLDAALGLFEAESTFTVSGQYASDAKPGAGDLVFTQRHIDGLLDVLQPHLEYELKSGAVDLLRR